MKALVTGGGGFLGGAIVRRLVERGDTVRTLQRGDYAWLDKLGVGVRRGDVADRDTVRDAVQGMDIVYHVAAKAGVWGPRDDYWQANYQGTANVLGACLAHGVSRLVLTSSPSVVFDGKNQSGVDESVDYPDKYLAAYPETKALAEQTVRHGGGDDLATVCLRPHLIWGPNDPHLVPRILDRARVGKLKLVGDGSNKVDSTYIDNAAYAHVLAGDALLRDGPSAACHGKVYFISNDEPLTMRDLLDRILDAGGLGPVKKTVSPKVAYAAGAAFELMYKLFRVKREPIMTRFVARQLATDHWFDLSAARRDFGYEPVVKQDEGFDRLARSLRDRI